jgi:signal transduction histidine kinase
MTECKVWRDALAESDKKHQELLASEERLRRLNEDILQMLMLMSHDIRGPLVALAATMKLLLRGSYGNMDERVRNTAEDLQGRIVRLLRQVEDYLEKAHSLEGSLEIEREVLDLRQDIIDPLLDELAAEIAERKIVIDPGQGAIPAGAIPVSANKIWLKTVLRNLFGNAVKYGGNGCRIAFGFVDHGGYYRLNVFNSGSPVPREDRGKLFTKYFRGDARSKEDQNGLGLGLYLIKEIISRHGGDIWYEARDNGSDFIFTIAKETIFLPDGTEVPS